jgi:hypothetical protein
MSAVRPKAEVDPKSSGSYQQGKQNTGAELGWISFDPAPFCAAPRPNQNRSLSMAVSAVIAAALRRYAYDYGELSHSASAKSPNPGQGYLARRRPER